MSAKASPLVFVLAAVAAAALLGAVAVDRIELVIAAVPLLLFLVRVDARPPAGFALAHALSTDRTTEGDTVAVTITLTARTDLPCIEVLYRLPAMAELASGSNRRVLKLAEGESESWTLEVRFLARGHTRLGRFHYRAWDEAGLSAVEGRYEDLVQVKVYPAAVPIRYLPRPRRTRSSFGNHVSSKLGQGLEPGNLRPYASGDRLRQINWRASLRTGRLYVTEFHEERNADVVILLDTTADIGRQPDSSLDYCVKAAAALATGYLRHRDRVGLITYGGNIQWIRPRTGRRQIETLLEALLPASMAVNYSFQGLDLLPPRVLPPGALVIALSPLIDPRFTKVVANLAGRGFDVLLLALSPLELMKPFVRSSPLDDLAARLWTLNRRATLDALQDIGLPAVEVRPDQPFDAALAPLARAGRPRATRR
ncbi:MAG: DUF58 domain-containing protein [Rhodospirillaceae bacterium]|nr:DUF58 domain-containing protein [Rhodospirillaceae bacterium]